MTNYNGFRGMSTFEQFNYTSRMLSDAYLENRPDVPDTGLFGISPLDTRFESTADRGIKTTSKTVKDDLTKLLVTLQRIKGMLPNPSSYQVSKGMADKQLYSLRNYLILSRMLIDKVVNGVTIEREPITLADAIDVINMLQEYTDRPKDLLRDEIEYKDALKEYFERLKDGRGEGSAVKASKHIPDFDQGDIAAFRAYKESMTDAVYSSVNNGSNKLQLLQFVKKGVTYIFNPFNILEKGAKATQRDTQFKILTFFKYKGSPIYYNTDVRDVNNVFYKITNATNWNSDTIVSSPKLNEPQLPLLLRLSLEAESKLKQLTAKYEEYVASMYKYPKADIEDNVKTIEDIANVLIELRDDKNLWLRVPDKTTRNFVNILISGPTDKINKDPLVLALNSIGNKTVLAFKSKWEKLEGDMMKDPRVVNPPP